ncbi:YegP family protein [Carnimonas bestiolae]|uniref:YegP family protein n=1 Tax=Carnimonas bestiolae TaxID=3402172 RepID=UPI003EDB787F
MSGKFELFVGKNDKFHFNLKAGNGEVILSSQSYSSKSSALNGIASVQKNSCDDAHYERLTAKDGSPYFTLKAANQQVIGTSEMYSSTQSRDKGIESVKANGGSEKIDDKTQ